MSEFCVEVVQVGEIAKHPNADSLGIVDVNGYPVIVSTKPGGFSTGDKAVYIPVDAIVDSKKPEFSFLAKEAKTDGKYRIRAKRLRGIFSMGMLVPASESMLVGDNVQEQLGIGKYDPEVSAGSKGFTRPDPGFMPKYDLEGFRRYKNLFQPEDLVVITEKIHGMQSRFVYKADQLQVASKGMYRDIDKDIDKPIDCSWWNIAMQYGLETKLAKVPGIAVYGEIYGSVQDLKYNLNSTKLAIFDIYDTNENKWLDWEDVETVCKLLELDTVPVLYTGFWDEHKIQLCEGKSTLADHVREGIVIKLARENAHPRFGRKILKMVGEGYLLRK